MLACVLPVEALTNHGLGATSFHISETQDFRFLNGQDGGENSL
jgi:hypothetical protein